jgi:hypothetical protein
VRDDFGIFILSHGRPDTVALTIKALTKARYSGRWWIVLDTDDDTAPEYAARWGADRLLVFDKAEVVFDMGDNGGPRGPVVVPARNAVPGLAADLGLTYYMELDDDYTYFAHRLEREGSLTYAFSYHLDAVIEAFIDWLDESGALTVAFAQGGDFIGGVEGSFKRPVLRKAMNTFIARVDRPIGFVGRLNEDTTTYVWRGGLGELFFTVTQFAINQMNTQAQPGGLTDAYLDGGTYRKSFYTLLWAPSCVTIGTIGELAHRIHHSIRWEHAVPKILPGRYRREGAEAS